jgi:hypothetical protein
MPNPTLHPRAAPGDRLKIWLGLFATNDPPALQWELDGQPVQPVALRPLTAPRTGDLLSSPNAMRVYTGIFEFTGPTIIPGSRHTVTITTPDGSDKLECSTIPMHVPDNEKFNVLLVSCFHQSEDKRGYAGHIVRNLPQRYKPHLTILMGDQVYLDLPTLRNYKDDKAWLAERFEGYYSTNWMLHRPGYYDIVSSAPGVSLPDDHEYWNNYPHLSPFIQNSWTSGGRERWKEAAGALYSAFQLPAPEGFNECVKLDVDPISFFFLDTRTHRAEKRDFSAPHEMRKQLHDWVEFVTDNGRIGIFITGQSLLDEARGKLQGSIGDYTLPNYSDFKEIIQTIVKIPDAGLPLILLTGDVHWGRVIEARHPSHNRKLLFEVISSPSSLVTTIVGDQLKTAWSALSRVFGKRVAWPRHSNPEPPPDFFGKRELDNSFPIDKKFYGQKGDHVVVLSFERRGLGLNAEVTYWPVHRNWQKPVMDHMHNISLHTG